MFTQAEVVGWAKRSVPITFTADRIEMLGTAQVRLCRPYEGCVFRRFRANCTISISMASPASTNSSSVIRAAPLRRTAPLRASSGMWMNAASCGLPRLTFSIARQLR